MDFSCTQWIMICYCHSLFWGSNCPNLVSGSPVNLCLFWHAPSFFEHFLIFWHNKVFQAYTVFFQSKPWNQPFSQGDLVYLSGQWNLEAKMCKIGVLIAMGHCCSQALKVDRARQYVCIYACIYISINFCIHIYIIVSSHSYLRFQSNIIRFIPVLSLSIFVTVFSDDEKCGSHYPLCFYLIGSTTLHVINFLLPPLSLPYVDVHSVPDHPPKWMPFFSH